MKGIEIRPPLSCSAPDEVVGIESSLVFGVWCAAPRTAALAGKQERVEWHFIGFLEFYR